MYCVFVTFRLVLLIWTNQLRRLLFRVPVLERRPVSLWKRSTSVCTDWPQYIFLAYTFIAYFLLCRWLWSTGCLHGFTLWLFASDSLSDEACTRWQLRASLVFRNGRKVCACAPWKPVTQIAGDWLLRTDGWRTADPDGRAEVEQALAGTGHHRKRADRPRRHLHSEDVGWKQKHFEHRVRRWKPSGYWEGCDLQDVGGTPVRLGSILSRIFFLQAWSCCSTIMQTSLRTTYCLLRTTYYVLPSRLYFLASSVIINRFSCHE